MVALIAAAEALALGGLHVPWGDLELQRKFLAAAVALVVLVVTLPRGRRRMAFWSLAFIMLAPLPFAVALLFPHAPSAPQVALDGCGLLLLASLLQSVLLVVAVSAWERVMRPMPQILLDVLRWLAMAVATVAVLYESGVNAENLFTGSAVVTAVLGFALRDTLGNVFAGLAIHTEHPFEIGHWIQYDQNPAHVGRVVEINWRATTVITLDEATVTIPNAQLAQASIRNFTRPEPWSRRSLYVITRYDVPPQRVQEIILGALRGSFGVLAHPAPSVVTSDFKERGVEHWVRLFTTEFDKRDRVDGMARDRIWYALARHGIEIPVATHAVRLTELPAPPPDPEASGVERRFDSLSRVGVLAALGPEQIRLLATENADRTYARGEQVIHQGDPGGSMFVIMSGRVEVTAQDGTAPPTPLAVLQTGDYFGEMSLMTGAPRVATVTALDETRLLQIGNDSFRRILKIRPELVEELGAALRLRLAKREMAIAGSVPPVPEAQDIFRKIRQFFAVEIANLEEGQRPS
jgi:small-conductance mechanosensitive channel/CRP-like cAMP-binding protein